VSIVTDGQGLNITVASYHDRLDFGFIADRELVPDVWDLADMHIAEITRLFDTTGAAWAQPPQPASPRRGPVKLTQTVTAPPVKKRTSTTGRARRKARAGTEGTTR
jgi:diacylglycerol O-acyltransferase